MASSTTGKCCVCGQETKDRCGACAKAGFDLFFCSREHQKLVWFAHKLVCGPKSKPFSFPPLSQDQVATVKANFLSEYYQGTEHETTVASALPFKCFAMGIDMSFGPTSPNVFDFLSASHSPSSGLAFDQHNELLSTIHHAYFQLRLESSRKAQPANAPDNPFEAPLEDYDPLGELVKAANQIGDALRARSCPVFPSSESWYILLMHRYLILVALHYVAHKEDVKVGSSFPLAASERKDHPRVFIWITSATKAVSEVTNLMDEATPGAREAVRGVLDELNIGAPDKILDQCGGQ
ncbi:hypothetical protein JCM8097_000043 [Rhodosporidiobolus ruineniae]